MSLAPKDAQGAKPALVGGAAGGELGDTVETDVVVVGAGAAGLTAANVAARLGREVVVLCAGDEVGGTTNKSGGGFLVHENRFHKAAGVFEDREMTLRLMARTSFPELYDPAKPRFGVPEFDFELLTTFYDRSAEVVEALEADNVLTTTPLYAVSGDPRGLPSYYSQLEEETIYHGRTIGTVSPDGASGFGRELIRQLLAGAERKGARVLLGQRVDAILRDDDGEVIGVTATAGGVTRTFLARHGVIFGTGGFAQNRELVERHLPGLVPGSCAVHTSQGDLISLTRDMDVELAHMECAWWGEVPLEIALEEREVPVLLFYPYGDSMIYVNAEGRRVVNEKAVYDQRGPIHFVTDEHGEQPNRVLFMIYDQAVARDPNQEHTLRWPLPPAGEKVPYVLEADTLEELAERIQERLATLDAVTGGLRLKDGFADELKRSIATFNGYAERGYDEEFQRGEEPVQVDVSGVPRPGAHPNPTMYPISGTGPYYCLLTAAGCLDTKGGPRINARAEILRTDGTPVPRLYGAGNCVASPSRGAYWSGGATLGLGMVYGAIAAEQVSALEARAVGTEAVGAGA